MAGRRRGFAIIEAIVASMVMAVGVTAVFGLWMGMFKRDGTARLVGEAGQLARAEVERAKVFGITNLPMGTVDSSTGSATWTGAFNASTGTWATSNAQTYDSLGNPLASATANGAAITIQDSIVDTNVLPNSTSGCYSFQLASRRSCVVTVTQVSDGTVLFDMATVIAPGGL